jgi:hypothetical protein
MAEENVRDGRPCLNGICVGDEISKLSGIKWAQATFNGRPISTMKMDNDKAYVEKLLEDFAPSSAPAVAAAQRYLRFGLFDTQGINKLSKVTGFCKPRVLDFSGVYYSDRGYETKVTVNVFAGEEPSSQVLRVRSITRLYSGNHTKEEMNELYNEFKERYKAAKLAESQLDTEPTWDFGWGRLELKLNRNHLNDADKLKHYPGCTKSLSVD